MRPFKKKIQKDFIEINIEWIYIDKQKDLVKRRKFHNDLFKSLEKIFPDKTWAVNWNNGYYKWLFFYPKRYKFDKMVCNSGNLKIIN